MSAHQKSPSRSQILRWKHGDPAAYARAVRSMRLRRIRELWITLGQRLGSVVGPLISGLLYLTLFLPFGIIGCLSSRSRGWRTVERKPGATIEELASTG